MPHAPKTALTGDKIYGTLVDYLKKSEAIQKLASSEPGSLENNCYLTLLNELRRISYQQTGVIYSSDAGKENLPRGMDKRIEKPDFETLADEFLKGKVKELNLSAPQEIEDLDPNMVGGWLSEFMERMLTIQPHTRNQTPHPTVTTRVRAFTREVELTDFLQLEEEGLRALFTTDKANISSEKIDAFLQRMESYADSLRAPRRPLTIEEEVKMSLWMSNNIYRSIPELAISVMRVAKKNFGIDINADNHQYFQELLMKTASDIVRNETWSPGDADSKPHMRPEQMEIGIRMGRLAIRKQYIRDLSSIAVQIPDSGDGAEGRDRIRATIWNMFNDITQLYPGDEDLARSKIEWFINQELCPAPLREKEIAELEEKFGEEGAKKHIAEHNRLIEQNRPAQEFVQELFSQYTDKVLSADRTQVKDAFKQLRSSTRRLELTKGTARETADAQKLQSARENFRNTNQGALEYGPEFFRHLQSNHAEIDANESNIGVGYLTYDEARKVYSSNEDKLKKDIAEIASLDSVKSVKYRDLTGQETSLPAISALEMQVNSYGLQAQRITHRQSRDAYDVALGELHRKIVENENGYKAEVYNKEQLEEIKSLYAEQARLEQLIDNTQTSKADRDAASMELKELNKTILEKQPEWTKSLITFLTSEEPGKQALITTLRHDVQRYTRENMERITRWQKRADDNPELGFSRKEQKTIFTYESLEMMRLGMYSDGAIARELIAESNGPQALWNVMALQELMKDPENMPNPKQVPKIVPLVEYPRDIENLPKTMVEAYSFEPFRKAQEKLTDPENLHSFLQVWDEKKKGLRQMEVRDLIIDIRDNERFGERFGLEVLEKIARDSGKTDMADAIAEQLASHNALREQLENPETPLAKRNQLQQQSSEMRNGLRNTLNGYLTQIEQNAPGMQELKEHLHRPAFYAEFMTAGSDAIKSGSTALLSGIAEAATRSKVDMAAFVGAFCTQKSGNGSAHHRNAISNAIIRMRQGLEMAQGPAILADETERVYANALRSQMKANVGIGADRLFSSIVNLGNTAGLEDKTSDAEFLEIRRRDIRRKEHYMDFYNSEKNPAYSAFFDACAPHKLFDIFKYAARPAGRIKKKSFDISTMRAIGFGLTSGASTGEPHLNLGLAEFVLKSDETGRIGGTEQRKENVDLFLKSPELQNEINRSMQDLVQFQPEIGWQNTVTGCRLKDFAIQRGEVNPDTGEITIEFRDTPDGNPLKLSLSDLAAMDRTSAAYNHLSQMLASHWMENENYIGKNATADSPARDHYGNEIPTPEQIISHIRMAAKMDLEMTKTLRAVTQLTADLAAQNGVSEQNRPQILPHNKPLNYAAASDPQTLVDNLKSFSPQLGSELQVIHDEQKENMGNISRIFRESQRDKAKMPAHPKEGASEAEKSHYQNSYHYFKRHTDIVENVCAAYYVPGHAAAVSQDRGMAKAA